MVNYNPSVIGGFNTFTDDTNTPQNPMSAAEEQDLANRASVKKPYAAMPQMPELNPYAKFVAADAENVERFVGRPVESERECIERARLMMDVRKMLDAPDEYLPQEHSAALEELNRRYTLTNQSLDNFKKQFGGDGVKPSDLLRIYVDKMDNVAEILSAPTGPRTNEAARAFNDERWNEAMKFLGETFGDPEYLETRRAMAGMSREEQAAYARDWMIKNGKITQDDLIDEMNADKFTFPVTESEKRAWVGSLKDDERAEVTGMWNPEMTEYIDAIAEGKPYKETAERIELAKSPEATKYREILKKREKWVREQRLLDKMEKSQTNERRFAEAMEIVPFMNEAQKKLVSAAAQGVDMNAYRGVFKLMDERTRNTMEAVCNAVRPETDAGLVSGLELGGKRFLNSMTEFTTAAFYQAFKDATAQDELAKEQKFNRDFNNTLGWDKLKDPSGWWEKAWVGLGESMPLQGSAIGGALAFRAATKLAPHPIARYGLTALGAGLEAMGLLSMAGDEYENLTLNGVRREDAIPLAFAAGIGNWMIENMNTEMILGTGLSAKELMRIGLVSSAKAGARCFSKKSVEQFGREFLYREFMETLRTDAAAAFKIAVSENFEEFVQGIVSKGTENFATGEKPLLTAFIDPETIEAGAKSFKEAMPTCTLFGISGALFPAGSAFGLNQNGARKGAMMRMDEQLDALLDEKVKNLGLDTKGEEFVKNWKAGERKRIENRAAQIVRGTDGMLPGESTRWLNEQADMTPAERAFYADMVSFFNAARIQVGEVAAKAYADSNLQLFRYEAGGAKIAIDPETGKVTGVTFKDTDGDVTIGINDLTGETATRQNLDAKVVTDFISAWNKKNPDEAFAANPAEMDDAELARLDKALAEKINGFYSESTGKITLTSQARAASLAHETGHATIWDALQNALDKQTGLSRSALRRIKARAEKEMGISRRDDEATAKRVEAKAAIEGATYKNALDYFEGADVGAAVKNVGKWIANIFRSKKAKSAYLPVIRKANIEAINPLQLVNEIVNEALPVALAEEKSRQKKNAEDKARGVARRGGNAADAVALRQQKREAKAAARKEQWQAIARKNWETAEAKAQAEKEFWDAIDAEIASEEAAQARRAEEEQMAQLKAEEAAQAEEDRKNAKMLKNRKNAVKKIPALKAPNGADASAAGVAAYQAAWRAKTGKAVTQEEVDQLAERYGLPPEALNLKKTDKGYVLADEQILSDESLAKLADGLTAFYRDLTSVRIQVPDVVVANAEEAANAVPNEVYDPVSDTFIEGRIVIDADKAKTFREEAGMTEPSVSPEEIEEARQRRAEQRKIPSGKQKSADTDYPSAANEIREYKYSIGSVTPEEDATYADAVARGDKETALRMIREAAAKAMPNTMVVDNDGMPLLMYHGTKNKFFVFDTSIDGKIRGKNLDSSRWKTTKKDAYESGTIFLTSDYEDAKAFGDGSEPMRVFVNLTNPKIGMSNSPNGAYTMYDDESFAKGSSETLIKFHDDFGSLMGDGLPDKIVATTKNGNAIKSADITYDDNGNLIPLSKRFDQGNVDIRFSLGKKAREDAKALILKKRPDLGFLGGKLPTTAEEINHQQEYVDGIIEDISKFTTPKEQKAALHWFIKGAIRLPEDAPKVTEAIKYGERAKGKANTDAMSYDSPMAMIEALHEFKPKAKPIDPDKVPQLSDKREMGNGVVTYLVQDDREGQQAMREIINTHWGEDANPWCLLHGDGYGHLSDGTDGGYDAWHYWNHYNALPKRVAFKDGKLLAFMATDERSKEGSVKFRGLHLDINGLGDFEELLTEDDLAYEDVKSILNEVGGRVYDGGHNVQDAIDRSLDFYEEMGWDQYAEWLEEHRDEFEDDNATPPEQWWDRQDASHEGIPLGNIPVPGDAFGRWADFEIRDGEMKQIGGFKKGIRGKDGFVEWYSNGVISEKISDGVKLVFNEDGTLSSYTTKDNHFTYHGSDVESVRTEYKDDNPTITFYTGNANKGMLLKIESFGDYRILFGRLGKNPHISVTLGGNYLTFSMDGKLLDRSPIDEDSDSTRFFGVPLADDSAALENAFAENIPSIENIAKSKVAEAERIYRENAQTQTKFSLILGEQGAANLDDNVKVLENLQVAKRMLGEMTADDTTDPNVETMTKLMSSNLHAKISWRTIDRDQKLKIKLATGWEVGVDGKWRYESADINRGLISNGDQDIKDKHNDLLKSRNEIVDKMNNLVKQMNVIWDRIEKENPKEAESFWGITPIVNKDPEYSRLKSEHKELDNEYNKIARKIGALKRSNTKSKLGGIKTSGYLDPFIEGQPVGKAYPQLFRVKLQFKSYKGSEYGHYDPVNNTIVVNARKTPDVMETTIIHEIQHAIQHIEGWTGGANYSSVGADAYRRNAGEVEARNAERRTIKDISTLLEDTEDESRDVQIVREDVSQALRKLDVSISSVTDAAAQDPLTPDISTRFSITNENDLKRVILDEFRGSVEARDLEWTDEQITGAVEGIFEIIAGVHAAVKGDKNYAEAAKAVPTLRVDWRDGAEKPIVTWVRGNIEYKYDMSADTFCINNEGLEQMLSDPTMADLMIAFSEDTEYGSDDYLRLYETLRDMGYVVPCKGCFDAAMRMKMLPSVAQNFISEVNSVIDERNKNPKKFDAEIRAKAKPDNASVEGIPLAAGTKSEAIRIGVAGDKLTKHIDWTQLMSAKGQTKALMDWGGIFRAWQKTGAGRPKDKLLPEAYGGVIISNTTTIIGKAGEKTPSFRDLDVNQGTGLRRNSHSEFRPTLIVDEIQFLRDCWLKGLCVFKYMKELDDVRLFGRMGIKYNMSAFPAFVEGCTAAGLDKNGNYVWAEESVGGREFEYKGKDGKIHYDGAKGFAEAQKYINKDVSLSCVIFSVPHLIKAMTDVPTKSDKRGLFGSLIGFHNSGADAKALEVQGLGKERACLPNFNPFEVEAMTDYHLGVTNFEQVQNDRFGEGWKILLGKKAGTDVKPGHKIEFANGTIYRNDKLGVTIYASEQTYRKNGGKERFGFSGPIYILDREGGKVAHSFDVSYNDKVRELGGDYAYQDAADFYIKEFAPIGILPRFDFNVPADVFVKMCKDAKVDPHHPKLGWNGGAWSPIHSEAYYSLFCDFGMTDPKTGKWSPHLPVLEGQRNADAFKNALPDDYLKIIKAGMNNFTRRKDRESKMDRSALLEYSRRSIQAGKVKAEKVRKVLAKHGFSASEIASLDPEFVRAKNVGKKSAPSAKSNRFSLGNDNAERVAALVGAVGILKGDALSDQALDAIRKSTRASISIPDLRREAERLAAENRRVLNYVAHDKAVDRLIARAGMADRMQKAIDRSRQADLAFATGVQKKMDRVNRANERVIRDTKGFTADTILNELGIDPAALLLSLRPADVAKPVRTAPTEAEQTADTPHALDATMMGIAQQRAQELLGKARDAVARAKAEEAANPVEIDEDGNKKSNRKGADENDPDVILGTMMQNAILAEIRNSGMSIDNPAEMVKLAEVITEDYIRNHAGLYQGIDLNDIWEDPRARALLGGNISRFAQMAAEAYCPTWTRERVAKKAQMLDDKAVRKLETIEEIGVHMFEDLNRDIVRESRKGLIKQIHKKIDTLARQHEENALNIDRKVSSALSGYLKKVKKAIDMSAEDVEKKIAELEDLCTSRYQGVDPDKANHYRDYSEAQDEIYILSYWGNLKSKMPSEIKADFEYLDQLVNEDLARMMADREEYIKHIDESVAAMVGGIAPDPKNNGKKPTDDPWAYSVIGMFEAKYRQYIRFCKDPAAAQAAREAFAAVEQMINDSTSAEVNFVTEFREKMKALVDECYGSADNARKMLTEVYDAPWYWVKVEGDTNPQVEDDVGVTAKRALQMYVSIVQDDYTENVEKWGRNGEYRAKLERLLGLVDEDGNYIADAPHAKFVEGLRALYLEMGDRLDGVLVETTGTHLRTPNRNYMPVKMDRRIKRGKNGEGRAFSPFAPSLTPRIKNGRDFDQTADIIDIFLGRLSDTAHTIGWAKTGPLIMKIAQSDAIINTIENNFGDAEARRWNNYIFDIVAGPKFANLRESKSMTAVMRYSSLLWLSLNLGSWAKQLTSIPCLALSNQVTFRDVAAGLSIWALKPIQMCRAAYDLASSDAFKARYGSAISNELRYAITDDGGFSTFKQKIVKGIMSGVVGFDKLGVLMASGVYFRRRQQLELQGKTSAEAADLAANWMMAIVDKSMQSGRTINLTETQRNGGLAAFIQFKSAPMQQAQFEMVAYEEWAADKTNAKKLKELVKTIVVNHFAVPFGMAVIDAAMAFITSWGIPDEEKRERLYARILGEIFGGPFGSLFLIGAFVEYTADVLAQFATGSTSKYGTGIGQLVPAEGAIEFMGKNAEQIVKALEDIDNAEYIDTAAQIGLAVGNLIPGVSYVTRTGKKIYDSVTEDPREREKKERNRARRKAKAERDKARRRK